jgi:hypothetical protein
MTMARETSRTDRHEFYIDNHWAATEAFHVWFRPLNPKNGRPWQASHNIIDGADVTPPDGQHIRWTAPVCYSTLELARAAVARKQEQLS